MRTKDNRGRKPKYIDENGNYDHQAMMEANREKARQSYYKNREKRIAKAKEYYRKNHPHPYQQHTMIPGHYIVTPNFIMEIVG